MFLQRRILFLEVIKKTLCNILKKKVEKGLGEMKEINVSIDKVSNMNKMSHKNMNAHIL